MNFAHFCEFWCFSLGKQGRFTLNFCSGMPLRKVHELTFLWFGLPGPLLRKVLPQISPDISHQRFSGRARFGSVTVWEWNGSSGPGFRFWRFLCKKKVFLCFSTVLKGKNGSSSGFGSWQTVPAVPVPLSVSGKTVPTVPVSGSGSVPEPPWIFKFQIKFHQKIRSGKTDPVQSRGVFKQGPFCL